MCESRVSSTNSSQSWQSRPQSSVTSGIGVRELRRFPRQALCCSPSLMAVSFIFIQERASLQSQHTHTRSQCSSCLLEVDSDWLESVPVWGRQKKKGGGVVVAALKPYAALWSPPTPSRENTSSFRLLTLAPRQRTTAPLYRPSVP